MNSRAHETAAKGYLMGRLNQEEKIQSSDLLLDLGDWKIATNNKCMRSMQSLLDDLIVAGEVIGFTTYSGRIRGKLAGSRRHWVGAKWADRIPKLYPGYEIRYTV